jgi:putative membrane protein
VSTVILLGFSLVDAPYPREQIPQHLPTVIGIALLTFGVRKNALSFAAVLCSVIFTWLHILGARYLYSLVPYDAWTTALFGKSLSTTFDWERNHFDRLVHFLFGLLIVLPAYEIARRFARVDRVWSLIIAVMFISTAGAIYEVVEWIVSIVMSEHDAESYNGQQGDYWDPQKDMALAFVGSMISSVVCYFMIKETESK